MQKIIDVSFIGRAGIAMRVEHHLSAIRGCQVHVMTRFEENQEGPCHFLSEKAHWKPFELGCVGDDDSEWDLNTPEVYEEALSHFQKLSMRDL